MKHSGLRPASGKQSGASAMEFALVLPLLIALTYSTFVYSYVFVVFESINYAAQLGAEAAAAVDPAMGDSYRSAVTTQVQNVVSSTLDWLPASQREASIGSGGTLVVPGFCDGSGVPHCPPTTLTGGLPVVVEIKFPLLDPQLFPILELPGGLGTIPPLPSRLTGVGVSLLSGGV